MQKPRCRTEKINVMLLPAREDLHKNGASYHTKGMICMTQSAQRDSQSELGET